MILGKGAVQTFSLQLPPLPYSLHLPQTRVIQAQGKAWAALLLPFLGDRSNGVNCPVCFSRQDLGERSRQVTLNAAPTSAWEPSELSLMPKPCLYLGLSCEEQTEALPLLLHSWAEGGGKVKGQGQHCRAGIGLVRFPLSPASAPMAFQNHCFGAQLSNEDEELKGRLTEGSATPRTLLPEWRSKAPICFLHQGFQCKKQVGKRWQLLFLPSHPNLQDGRK